MCFTLMMARTTDPQVGRARACMLASATQLQKLLQLPTVTTVAADWLSVLYMYAACRRNIYFATCGPTRVWGLSERCGSTPGAVRCGPISWTFVGLFCNYYYFQFRGLVRPVSLREVIAAACDAACDRVARCDTPYCARYL